MTQVSTTNYTASGFTWATTGNDQFRITDLQNLAIGVEGHDHTSTFGLPVMRIGGGCAVGTTVINGAGTLTFPTTTDTLVGRATTDTLTNKTIKAPLGGPAVRVYSTAINSIANNVQQAVVFDTTRYNTDSNWAGGSPTRLTATTAGYYSISGQFTFASNTVGDRQVEIRLNGVTYLAAQTAPAVVPGAAMSVTTQWHMVAGDYVELVAFQTSGGNLNQFAATGASNAEFMMLRITG